MNLLMFSLDQSLLLKPEISLGDTLERLLVYAKFFNNFVVLIPTNNPNFSEIKIQNILIIPCFGKGKFRFLSLYKEAKKICSRLQFDLIVTNDAILGFLGYLIKNRYGGKLNINVFGSEFYNHYFLDESFYNKFLALLARYSIKKADLIRTDTTCAANLMNEKDKIKSEKIHVIPVSPSKNSIEQFLKAKRDENLRIKLLGKDYEYLILTVSSYDRCKDIPTLLKAIQIVSKNLPKAKFVIAGRENGKEKIEKLISDLKIENNVILAGIIPYLDLPSYYASADLYVLPSMHEGFPRVLMEAGFAKLPVVSTDIDGAFDLIEHGKSGYICEVSDSEDIAKKIEELLKNKDKSKEMGEKLHRKVIEYCDFEKNLEKMKKMWGVS